MRWARCEANTCLEGGSEGKVGRFTWPLPGGEILGADKKVGL